MLQFITQNTEIIQQVHHFFDEWQNNSDTIVTKTSGSTGVPKEIVLKKEFMRNSALASGKFFGFQKGQRMRLALSPQTIGGKMLLLRGLLHEMIIEIVEPSKQPLEEVSETIDFISFVPYQLAQIIENQPEKLKKVKTILLGGATISAQLNTQIQGLENAVYASYGMTETMSHVALRDVKKSIVFQAIDGVKFSIGEQNQLIINAPNLGIHDLITNDVVKLLSSTAFEWQGRLDFVINSAGVKIHPEKVENALSTVVSSRFFIIGEPDETFGERVVLVIEGEQQEANFQFEKHLSKYEIPKRIVYFRSFVKTDSGKINRLETKKLIDESQNR